MRTNDPIELIIGAALDRAGIRDTHESDKPEQRLDFHLTDYDVFIECKQFGTERTGLQILQIPDVIAIQGRAAALMFARLIGG